MQSIMSSSMFRNSLVSGLTAKDLTAPVSGVRRVQVAEQMIWGPAASKGSVEGGSFTGQRFLPV